MDALAIIVHKDKARTVGKRVCAKLKENIRRLGGSYVHRGERSSAIPIWHPSR